MNIVAFARRGNVVFRGNERGREGKKEIAREKEKERRDKRDRIDYATLYVYRLNQLITAFGI